MDNQGKWNHKIVPNKSLSLSLSLSLKGDEDEDEKTSNKLNMIRLGLMHEAVACTATHATTAV